MIRNIKNNIYAILDYDGFVCKAFYANKEDPMNIQAAANILKDLETAARDKTADFFGVPSDEIHILRIMSGHSWKKDIYPSYKRKRKKDEFLGVFRDKVKNMPRVRVINQLEADEVIVLLSDYLSECNINKYIVFSDDKDLRFYCPVCCKINITEEVHPQDFMDVYTSQLEQMLIGDSEDNIKGIPKVGEKTAPKLLSKYGYNLKGVIKCFKDNGVDIDNCLRDLLLVIPLSKTYRHDDPDSEAGVAEDIIIGTPPVDQLINRLLIGQIQYLNEAVKGVYDNEEN